MSYASEFLEWVHSMPKDELDRRLSYKQEGAAATGCAGTLGMSYYREGKVRSSLTVFEQKPDGTPAPDGITIFYTVEGDGRGFLEFSEGLGRRALAVTGRDFDFPYPDKVDDMLRALKDNLESRK